MSAGQLRNHPLALVNLSHVIEAQGVNSGNNSPRLVDCVSGLDAESSPSSELLPFDLVLILSVY